MEQSTIVVSGKEKVKGGLGVPLMIGAREVWPPPKRELHWRLRREAPHTWKGGEMHIDHRSVPLESVGMVRG